MDLHLSPENLAFRAEARRFFADEFPDRILRKVRSGQFLERRDYEEAQRALQDRGWLAASWPSEFGGTGWTPVERYLFEEELERAGAPNLVPMGLIYIGPIICAFGTAEQQAKWLPDILHSRSFWAQGYSEPDSGSDLASLQFSARREGDEYILQGSKIWTSGAHMADWIFCLCRTSHEDRKQDGISMICAPMNAPGISVRPIVTIDGSHELNQVFFTDVRVPVSNRIGEEGRAWHYANVLLKNERLSYAHVGRKKRDLETLRAMVGGDRAFARRLAEAEVNVVGLEMAVLNALVHGCGSATVASLKIMCTEAAQQITELFLDRAGEASAAFFDRSREDWHAATPLIPEFAAIATASYFFERAQTIYGGTTEIQKNLIWREIGGASLPRPA